MPSHTPEIYKLKTSFITSNMTRPNPATFAGAMKSLNLDIPSYEQAELESMRYPELAQAKTHLESTLETLFDLLHNTYKFDMDTPLVVDGFPRNDVDVVSIRLVRTNIIRLRNDHSLVLRLLETHLAERLLAATNTQIESLRVSESPLTAAKKPFATVREVAPESPAATCGLRPGDRIVSFDTDIDASNHAGLTALAARVQEKIGLEIPVEILRHGETSTVTLVPRQWAGRGVLGCHIVPC